jgi:outer membrane receptor protein involved in Fe transport
VRIGRSYRHPNLEELLFAGPATAGSIAPNIKVKPETGVNFDVGTKFAAGRVRGGVYVFVNQYENFIAQDLVVALTPSGPLAQTVLSHSSRRHARVPLCGVRETARRCSTQEVLDVRAVS